MHKGEIWLINLDPAVGAELRKARPAVIVSQNAIGILPRRVIVPLTDWKERYAVAPWMARIDPDERNGLDKPSAADAFQIRSVARERFASRIGILSEAHLQSILAAIRVVVGV
jgi:mRNA interferase MazF